MPGRPARPAEPGGAGPGEEGHQDETGRIDRDRWAGRPRRDRLDAAGGGLYRWQLHERSDAMGDHRADSRAGWARDRCSRAARQAAGPPLARRPGLTRAAPPAALAVTLHLWDGSVEH